MREFVIGYGLCPYAERVFSAGTVRYRVCLDKSRAAVVKRLKLEVIEALAIGVIIAVVLKFVLVIMIEAVATIKVMTNCRIDCYRGTVVPAYALLVDTNQTAYLLLPLFPGAAT